MGQSSRNSGKSSRTDQTLNQAEKLREKSDYRQALRLFKKVLQEYVKISDREGALRCMLSLGDTYRMVGDFDLASENYRNAQKLVQPAESPVESADANVGLGLSLRAQGKWKEAIKLIRKSKNIYEKMGDRQGIAFTLWAEAGALRIKGDIPGAIKTYKESKKIFKSLKDLHGVGYCLCGLGGASRVAGLFRDSLNYYTAANRLFSDIHDTFGRAYSYCGTGNALRMLKDYKNAFTNFKKAVRLYEKIGDRVSNAYTLWGLGTTYKMIGKFSIARYYFMKAMTLFRNTKDPRGIIYCKLGFGEIFLLNGKTEVAKRHILAAQADAKNNNFALEQCYADTLISFMTNNPPQSPFSKGGQKGVVSKGGLGGFSGKIHNACYNQLGLKLKFQELPLNIP